MVGESGNKANSASWSWSLVELGNWVDGWLAGWLKKADIKPTQPSWSWSWGELVNNGGSKNENIDGSGSQGTVHKKCTKDCLDQENSF